MILYFIVVWIILSLIDISLTVHTISLYRRLYPSLDYTQIEKNRILRFLFRNLGLIFGGIVFAIFSVILILIILNAIFLFMDTTYIQIGFGIIVGIYLLVIFIHFSHMKEASYLLKASKNPNLKKYVEEFQDYKEKMDELWTKITSNEPNK